jgi:hypothetical protein
VLLDRFGQRLTANDHGSSSQRQRFVVRVMDEVDDSDEE